MVRSSRREVYEALGTFAPGARLIPGGEKVCTGKDLADALAHVELSTAEALAWRRDLARTRKALKSPEDKWR